MRYGILVAIPLTVLQFGVHHNVSPQLVAQNVLLCNAIYDADRFTEDTPEWNRRVSQLSALAATTLYLQDPHLRPLAPLVPVLHRWYGSVLKPYLAPVKPFFVSLLWCTLVCYVPDSCRESVQEQLPLVGCALFLNIAALSHAADIVDLEEDRDAGLDTPAVVMGVPEAVRYAFALEVASIVVDVTIPHSSSPHVVYDVASVLSLIGITTQRRRETALASVALAAAYLATHDLELITTVLKSTEMTHSMAIEAAVDLADGAMSLDEPLRSRVVDLLFRVIHGGDEVGSALIRLFETALRNRIR